MHARSPLCCVRRDHGQAHLIHDHSTGRSSTRERDASLLSRPVLHALAPPRCLPQAHRSRCASGSVCLRSEEDLIPGCLARQTHISHTHSHKQIHSQASMHLQAATRPWAPPLDGTRPRSLISCALAYGMRSVQFTPFYLKTPVYGTPPPSPSLD
jgi:hypothetical protein